MNNKGFIDNIFLVIITIVGFFVLIVGFFIYGSIKDALNTNALFSGNEDAQGIFSDIDTTNESQDWLFVLLFFGVCGAILIGLYYLRSSPAFFLVGLIGLVVVVFLAIILRDVFSDVINSTSDFSDEVTELPKANFIFENLPVIMLVIVSGFLIFAYVSKSGLSGGYG